MSKLTPADPVDGRPHVVVAGPVGKPVTKPLPRRGLAWRLASAWSKDLGSQISTTSICALMVWCVLTEKTPKDQALHDAGDEALDQLLDAGWTEADITAAGLEFAAMVPRVYPRGEAEADFSKAQPDPKTST